MQEEWKQFQGFETYWFSSLGNVERRKGNKRRPMIGTSCGQIGYRAIDMHDSSGDRRRVYIHRAVCELFNGPAPEGRNICRHLDTNKDNNAASNLAWGTALDNANDGIKAGKHTRGERNPLAKLTWSAVGEMRSIRSATGAPYRTLAQMFGVSTMTAYRAISKESWNV